MLSFFMSENKYHRYLNIPKYIPNVDFTQWNSDHTEWIQFHKALTFNQLRNQNIEPWLNILGMTSNWIEVFCTPPNSKGLIHSDNAWQHDWAKLIFQYGAPGSTMRWWESDKLYTVSTSVAQNPKELIQVALAYQKLHDAKVNTRDGSDFHVDSGDRTDDHYHGKVLVALEDSSEIVYESQINQSSLINAGVLHSSYNPTNQKRFVVTIALCDLNTQKRILWDDAIEILEDYIVE